MSNISPSGIELSLSNLALWQKFPAPMEMVVKPNTGRMMFPGLEYSIKGLHPAKMYEIHLHMERVDGFKYTFFEDNQWNVLGTGEPPLPVQMVEHKSGAQLGVNWMSNRIDFEQVRLTNDPNSQNKDKIYLQSRHKWRPVITVCEVPAHGASAPFLKEEFRIAGTEFITVTSYQNPAIKSLKVDHNKFCAYARKRRNGSTNSSSTLSSAIKRPSIPPPDIHNQQIQNAPICYGVPGSVASTTMNPRTGTPGYGALGMQSDVSIVPGAPSLGSLPLVPSASKRPSPDIQNAPMNYGVPGSASGTPMVSMSSRNGTPGYVAPGSGPGTSIVPMNFGTPCSGSIQLGVPVHPYYATTYQNVSANNDWMMYQNAQMHHMSPYGPPMMVPMGPPIGTPIGPFMGSPVNTMNNMGQMGPPMGTMYHLVPSPPPMTPWTPLSSKTDTNANTDSHYASMYSNSIPPNWNQ